jgi:hypothetical protein
MVTGSDPRGTADTWCPCTPQMCAGALCDPQYGPQTRVGPLAPASACFSPAPIREASRLASCQELALFVIFLGGDNGGGSRGVPGGRREGGGGRGGGLSPNSASWPPPLRAMGGSRWGRGGVAVGGRWWWWGNGSGSGSGGWWVSVSGEW